MSFSEKIRTAVADKHLLQHPFYQDWSAGKLDQDILREYACQYSKHVDALPRYISAAHSMCESLEERKHLLENLNDEENNGTPHPILWHQFAEGLGASKQEMEGTVPFAQTNALIDTMFEACRSSYAEGLAALYVYEQQVPEVATEKIRGLKEFYGIADDRTLEFFTLHRDMDVIHREECTDLLDKLPAEDQEKAMTAARKAAEALWNFLTGIQENVCNQAPASPEQRAAMN